LREKLQKVIHIGINRTNLWDALIALRLYLIVFFIFYPIIYFSIHFGYLSPVSIIIIGFSIWIIARFVLFEKRRGPLRLLKISIIGGCIILLNFTSLIIISVIHNNNSHFIEGSIILLVSALYFYMMITKKPFKKLNSILVLKKAKWTNDLKHKKIKQNIFKNFFISWLLISISLLIIPYSSYIQKFPNSNPSPKTDFGIWTYGQALNKDNHDEPDYVDDKALRMLGKADVYFIYGVTEKKIGHKLIENLNRCKNHDIEVHISVNPLKKSYTNIWTFEGMRDEVEEILNYLKNNNMLGDPITTLVYDMELLPDNPTPHYYLDPNVIDKLDEYDEIQEKFDKFNDEIREEFDLKIRIVSDIYQAIDYKDKDDDLMRLQGLMSYDNAKMSYMVYRRNNYGRNQILDHLKFLNEGDTIILNAWRDVGYRCYRSIKCAIFDSRLVLGYPKSFRLEIWELSYFLFSYGIDGLYDLVEAINEDPSEWDVVYVHNSFPFSLLWDLNFLGIVAFDIYAPLFRIMYKAY